MEAARSVPTFKEQVLSLRGHYGSLKCGRHVLVTMLLWVLNIDDIPNMEHYLRTELGWSMTKYKRHFNRYTREMFRDHGIKDIIDITAIMKVSYYVE